MADLSGSTIASTYDRLLALPSGGGATTTLKAITDGDGTTTFCLQLATTKAMIEGSGNKLFFHDEGDEHISAAGGDLTIAAGTALNITADVIDLSDATKDITLNSAVDAINFDSNTLSIDASNNRVGIGTAAPSSALTVSGGAYDGTRQIDVIGTHSSHASSSGGVIKLSCNDGAVMANAHKLGSLVFGGAEDTSDTIVGGAKIEAYAAETWSGSANGTDLRFSVTANTEAAVTERMCILDSGFVGIGNNSPDTLLHIGTDTGNAHTYLTIECDTGNNCGIYFTEERTNKWVLYNDGDDSDKLEIIDVADSSAVILHLATTGTAWVEDSDERIKKDIVNVGSVLDSINQLRPVTYKRKYSTHDNTYVGLIAQEVKAQFPIVVNGDENDFVELTPTEEDPKKYKGAMGIEYTSLIPYLIKSIQELSAKVTALENA